MGRLLWPLKKFPAIPQREADIDIARAYRQFELESCSIGMGFYSLDQCLMARSTELYFMLTTVVLTAPLKHAFEEQLAATRG